MSLRKHESLLIGSNTQMSCHYSSKVPLRWPVTCLIFAVCSDYRTSYLMYSSSFRHATMTRRPAWTSTQVFLCNNNYFTNPPTTTNFTLVCCSPLTVYWRVTYLYSMFSIASQPPRLSSKVLKTSIPPQMVSQSSTIISPNPAGGCDATLNNYNYKDNLRQDLLYYCNTII